MKKFVLFVFLMFFVGLFAGCEINPSVNLGSDVVVGITITSQDNVRTIKVNETLQLTAKVFPETASQEVEWSSSNETIATVDELGLVTGVNKGNVEIIAKSKVNEAISQSFSLIIEEGEVVLVDPESVTISALNDVTTCKAGEIIQLSAVVLPSEASQSVSWTSSDPTIATVLRGEVSTLKEGTVVITANAKGFEDVKATITLTVEKASAPVVTEKWNNMEYSTHQQYIDAEDNTPLKVKGVVTHINPQKDGEVTYLIQNGAFGYYVYAQDVVKFPVEVGSSYEVCGYKKNYRGLSEIVDVEFCTKLEENIEYTLNNLDNSNPSNYDAMTEFQGSFVNGKAVFVSAAVAQKAYSFTAKVNNIETTFRVDPSTMSTEEFAKINILLSNAISGNEFTFVGYMSAFGYSDAVPQIHIVKTSDLGFGEVSDEQLLNSIVSKIKVSTSVPANVNTIDLMKAVEGYSNILVEWTSDNDAINVETLAVTHKDSNITVKLTVKLSLNEVIVSVSFDVLVVAIDNATYEVVATLDLEDASTENSWGNSATKPSYAEGNVELGTPKYTWLLRNALISSTSSDKYQGIYGIRAQSHTSASTTARIELKNDVECNAIEFDAAIYGNDATGLQIRIEYSTDSGANWKVSDQVLTIDNVTLDTFRIKLPETANRIAIVVVENSGRRVNLDNIKVLK